mmetsp:Transcript_32863/g.47460  ORF Transcript_32863/g.47460 Transcript_32863/m.47460 type:complete len:214 (+) Transcript_32863:212-853(+)
MIDQRIELTSSSLKKTMYSYAFSSSFYGIFPIILFLIHCSKRWWECLHITDFGASEIHVAGFVVGILHYILVPLSIFLSIHEHRPQYQGSVNRIAVTLTVFALSSYYQGRCHYILYQLKRNSQKSPGSSSYSLPREGLFHFVCCPHYTMEVILYMALWQTLPQSLTCLLIAMWTLSNLSVMAYKQYFWYFDNFRDDFIDGDKKHWRILIPGVW